MLAVSGPAVGAIIGLLIGIALSISVARTDWRKVRTGVRTRPAYRASLVIVPLALAGIGALIGSLF